MAIYSSVAPPAQQAPAGIDIESWTASALQSLSVSPTARGTGVSLSIPLDSARESEESRNARASAYKSRKEPVRRDSLKNRDALLKGKEGSRRRQRWENDHLLHVPNAQPPLPSDWQVHSTSPIRNIPYYLAPLWENGVRHRAEELAAEKKIAQAQRTGLSSTTTKGRIPQELRQKLKKSKGAKTLLQELEEEIRKFVRDYERKELMKLGRAAQEQEEISEPEVDSEDEEIVFVGRNGTMSDEQRKTVEEELEREKKVFDSLADETGASFGRWLVHSIAQYYGLTSRSVTVGDPQRREAWVGIKGMKSGREVDGGVGLGELPRPLWGLV